MQTYIDNGGGTITIAGMMIPKDEGNRDYQKFLQLQAAGEATLVEPTVGVAMQKSAACSRIDAKAEALRQGVLTPGAGQAIEYQKTCAEAAAVIALAANGTTTVTVGTYKYLEAEQAALAATTGTLTLLQVAQAIQADVAAADAVLAAIKQVRRTAKIKITAATDAAGVAAAEAAVVWPL